MAYKDKFLDFFASSAIFAAATSSVAKPAIKALPELKTSVSAYATANVSAKSKQPSKAYFTKPSILAPFVFLCIFYHKVVRYV
nr:MAG TPA: hypothetical protein [Caudoviricetes sp.]